MDTVETENKRPSLVAYVSLGLCVFILTLLLVISVYLCKRRWPNPNPVVPEIPLQVVEPARGPPARPPPPGVPSYAGRGPLQVAEPARGPQARVTIYTREPTARPPPPGVPSYAGQRPLATSSLAEERGRYADRATDSSTFDDFAPFSSIYETSYSDDSVIYENNLIAGAVRHFTYDHNM